MEILLRINRQFALTQVPRIMQKTTIKKKAWDSEWMCKYFFFSIIQNAWFTANTTSIRTAITTTTTATTSFVILLLSLSLLLLSCMFFYFFFCTFP